MSVKISELPQATALSGIEQVPIVQDNTTVRTTAGALGLGDSLPIGSIFSYGGTVAPVGSLVCNGAAISRTLYADLFEAIGTTWGVGNGTTTFNLPDLRGAFVRGNAEHGSETMADGNPFEGPDVGDFEDDQFQGHRHDLSYVVLTANNDVGSNWVGLRQSAPAGEIPEIVKDPIDGDDGTVRTGDETKPFAAGVLYCIKATKNFQSPDPVSLGSFRYDTGWVANNDWTDFNPTITHNLDAPLTELIVQFYISPTGADDDVLSDIRTAYDVAVPGPNFFGQTIKAIDNNSFEFQSGANGILYNDGTSVITIDNEAWYYKVMVYKPELISPTYEQSLASFLYDTGPVAVTSFVALTETITHNLGVPIEELIVEVWVYADDPGFWIRPGDFMYDQSTAGVRDGNYTLQAINDDSFRLQFGASGIYYAQNGTGVTGNIGGSDTGELYRVRVYKPEIMADIIPTTLADYKFTTGWVANSDWTDLTLDIVHNLGAALEDLIVTFAVSSTSNGANAINIEQAGRTDGAGTTSWTGWQIEVVDSNTIRLQTGSLGILYLDSSGTGQRLDVEAWFYNVTVYSPQLIQTAEPFGTVAYDISAANQSYTLPSTQPLNVDITITWTGGAGTYVLSIDPDAGYTLDGELTGVWEGEGEGKMVVRRVSNTQWSIISYHDAGDFTDGLWRKTVDGQVQMSHQVASVDVDTASGQIYRSDPVTWTFPITLAAVESVFFQGWADSMWGGVDAAPTTTGASGRLYAQVSRTGRTANMTAHGRWK